MPGPDHEAKSQRLRAKGSLPKTKPPACARGFVGEQPAFDEDLLVSGHAVVNESSRAARYCADGRALATASQRADGCSGSG